MPGTLAASRTTMTSAPMARPRIWARLSGPAWSRTAISMRSAGSVSCTFLATRSAVFTRVMPSVPGGTRTYLRSQGARSLRMSATRITSVHSTPASSFAEGPRIRSFPMKNAVAPEAPVRTTTPDAMMTTFFGSLTKQTYICRSTRYKSGFSASYSIAGPYFGMINQISGIREASGTFSARRPHGRKTLASPGCFSIESITGPVAQQDRATDS